MTGQMQIQFDHRGQSGILGYTLLVGLVIVGAIVVVMGGSAVIDSMQQEQAITKAEVVMEDVDSQLSTLTSSEQTTQSDLELGEFDRTDARLVRDGFLNVTVNGNTSCASHVPLSSLRYENDAGQTVAYQAGGVWRAGSNGSSVQTPPSVEYRNGSLSITVVNLTGSVSPSQNDVRFNATSSERQSRQLTQQLVSEGCGIPHNVTLAVQSDFYVAWGSYLRDEFDTTVRTFEHNRTAVLTLNQSQLPRRIDNDRNAVVNFSAPAYMHHVTLRDNRIRVSKNTSNSYRVYVQPLSGSTPNIGHVQVSRNATNVTGPPIDVVFVLDESGSMAWNANPGRPECDSGESDYGCTSKREAAFSAAQRFTTYLNSSQDRLGFVGFYTDASDRARFFRTNERYMTQDFDAFNETLEEINADGGTYIWAGLRDGIKLHGLNSNQSRKRVIVLLTDGRNDPENFEVEIAGEEYTPDEATGVRADQAEEMGVTVHTVGFGDRDEIAVPLLRDISDTTGGQYYYADNANALRNAFENIATRIASTQQVALTPTSTTLTGGGGQVYAPQIAGDTDGLAFSTSDGTEFLNVNDPTAPTHFTYAFSVNSNESVSVNASTYNCAEWRGTGRTRSHNGTTYQVTRCTNMTTTDEVIGASNSSIYYDGSNISGLLAADDPAWWQQSIEEMIDSSPAVSLNGTTLEMGSNQALIVLDYPDPRPQVENRMLMLYQIGRSEASVSPEGIINVRVRNVQVTN